MELGGTDEVTRLRLLVMSRLSALEIAASAVMLCVAPAARFNSAPTNCLPRIATALPPVALRIKYKSEAEYVTPPIVRPELWTEVGNGCFFLFFQNPIVAGHPPAGAGQVQGAYLS